MPPTPDAPTPGSPLPANGSRLPTDDPPLPANGSRLPADDPPLPADGSRLPATSHPPTANGERPPATKPPATGRDFLRFPHDLLRIVYWAYARPFTLERYLKQFDPKLSLDTGLLTLWRRGREHPPLRHLVYLTLFHALVTPWLAFPLAWGLQALGMRVLWVRVLWGVLWGVLVGVGLGESRGELWGVLLGGLGGALLGGLLGVLGGVSGGVLVGVLVGVLGGVLEEGLVGALLYVLLGLLLGVLLLGGVLGGLLGGVLGGLLGGVLGGLLGGFLGGLKGGLKGGLEGGMEGGLLGISLGVLLGTSLGVLPGIVLGVLGGLKNGLLSGSFVGGILLGSLVAMTRLYEYPFLALVAWALGRLDAEGRWVRASPPFWHEVIVLPLPGVEAQVLRLARRDPDAGLQAVEYLAAYRYAWARRVAARAALRMALEQAAAAHTLQDLAGLYARLKPWLRPEVRARWEDLVSRMETVTGKVRAALESDTAYNRYLRLQEALETVQGWREALRLAGDPLAGDLLPILQNWQALLEQAVAQAQREEFIPNPYVAGTPLAGNNPTFKGRRDLMRRLEAEFAAFATQRPALLLFGGRRVGKTSLIAQLPVRLGPEVVPLTLDMQSAAAVGSPQAFWERIMAEARKQALEHRGLTLPQPDPERLVRDPFAAFLHWLDAVEARARGVYFLLALDEYEKIQEALAEGRLNLRVLDLFRHLLQHRRQWLVLFSGQYTFDDLPLAWSDRFINVRYFPLGPLEEDAARELILRPIPEFAGRVHYSEEAVARLIAVTGRQPNWLQAALKALIRRLNQERRREVTLADVDWALAQVPREVSGDFRYFWETPLPFPDRLNDPETRRGYQEIVRTLALEPGISREDLQTRVSAAARPLVADTLDFFLRRYMLVEADGGYRWAFPLLEKWLRERA